jgi:uncharacterized HAD superfamily protein
MSTTTNHTSATPDVHQNIKPKHTSIVRIRRRAEANRIRIDSRITERDRKIEDGLVKTRSEAEKWLRQKHEEDLARLTELERQREKNARLHAERQTEWAKQDEAWRAKISKLREEMHTRLTEWEQELFRSK